MASLFDPFPLRGITLTNRIVVSPMCQYSSVDGFANEWHLVHLGSRAVGGAGLVFTEATAVLPEGRISPEDLGIWSDAHVDMLARIVRFVRAQGTPAGMQLAHAGRKGSTPRPWDTSGRHRIAIGDGGWQPVGPDTTPFADGYPEPRALARDELPGIAGAFAEASRRALEAGFDVIEIHAAHGYLLHEFLSPLSNSRSDEYGGSFENRIRLTLDVVSAVRGVWPERLPLFLRISATDWVEGGWDLEQSIELARRVTAIGVDVIDCSSGGNVARAKIEIGPGYQTPFAARIRREAGIATAAVGMITSPAQAQQIVQTGQADCVVMARELLRDPYWPLRAARELGVTVAWPAQYVRAAAPQTPIKRESGIPARRPGPSGPGDARPA